MTSPKLARTLAVSESGFLFLATTGETFTVNDTGRTILAALQSSKSEDEVVAALAAEYDADTANVRRDLDDFVSQLRQYGLLVDE